MGALVPGETTAACESFVTLVAFEGFLASVDALVPDQVTLVCEVLVTRIALERFLSSVGALVHDQAAASRKALSHAPHLNGFSPV